MTDEKKSMFRKDPQNQRVVEYLEKLMEADEGFAGHVLEIMSARNMGTARISAAEGRILEAIVRASNAKKAVEIGTLAGYSGHWLARGMPEGGRLYTLEKDPSCVSAAKECFERSNLSRRVTVLEGAALENLKTLSKLAPFDFCFIDADEESYPAYLRWAAVNLKPGGMAAASGVFLKGKVCMEEGEPSDNVRARAMREFFHVLFDSDRFVSAAVIPTGEGLVIGIK
ncbi:MAG: hypothetical protein A2270_03670 [Elusimicrobia bacterium RIFOXYA12_FULL_51_18]|nr:MAG: hypothetical protein A2270_03670 [Elusimicrobia bacterium RIFOXYA12_FULL_51_18]OGS31942.1 MAG: hypothetical protein A2218_06635 [Elusimicrobia bacterium RIFOXYA2_FULL_53_38]